MRKQVLLITTAAGILICSTILASAQAPGSAGSQGPTSQPIPPADAGAMIQDHDQDLFSGYHGMMRPGMMGHGVVGGEMMGHGYGHHGWDRGHDVAGPMMMRMIFSLMDADGDGKLTLQEWQSAHERIFKAMDANHDGTVTLEEMQAFIRGHQ
jgi:EF hand